MKTTSIAFLVVSELFVSACSIGVATNSLSSADSSSFSPTIFSVADTGSAQSPQVVNVAALEDIPHACYWDRKSSVWKGPKSPPATGWYDVENDAGLLTYASVTPALQILGVEIQTCLRQRDVAYNLAMSSKYLGGGDLMKSNFQWNFGDEGSAYNTIEGFSASHIYYNNSKFPVQRTITLTVTTNTGLTGVAQKVVTIQPDVRPVLNVSTQAEFNAALSQMSGKKVILQSGATFTLGTINSNNQGLALGTNTYLTTSGSAPAIVVANYTSSGGKYPNVLSINGSQTHAVAENISVQIAPSSVAPYIAAVYDSVTNVAFKGVTFVSNQTTAMEPNLAFYLPGGRGILVQDSGGTSTNPAGIWPSTGTHGEWTYIEASNVSYYGNYIYAASAGSDPGIRACSLTSQFISIAQNKIGGQFGKNNVMTLRAGHNFSVFDNFLRGGTADVQSQCGGNDTILSSTTANVVFDSNHTENVELQINAGVFNVGFRNNFFHMNPLTDTAESSIAPFEGEEMINIALSGSLIPGGEVYMASNSFIYEITAYDTPDHQSMTFYSNPEQSVDLINNLFYVPAPEIGNMVLPDPGVIRRSSGNVFLLNTNSKPSTMAVAYTSTSLTVADWNAIYGGRDQLFDVSQASFTASAGGENLNLWRPTPRAVYASSALNLGLFGDNYGVIMDMGNPLEENPLAAAIFRTIANTPGWTPGSLQAEP